MHVHHAFLSISLLSLHNCHMKWPNCKFTLEQEHKVINSTISVWTQAWAQVFTSTLNSLLLSNRMTWDDCKIVSKDVMSIFQRHFHEHHHSHHFKVSNSWMVCTLQKLTTQPILKWRIAKQAFNKMTNIYLKALEHRAASSYVVRLEAALGPPWTNSSNDACKIYELLKRFFLCPGKDKRLKKTNISFELLKLHQNTIFVTYPQ